jgi:pilus assembly protein Flp/PilA
MGPSERHGLLSNAARGLAAYSNVAGSSLKRFALEKNGATAIEYAIITSIITITILLSMQLIGTTLSGFFQSIKFGG